MNDKRDQKLGELFEAAINGAKQDLVPVRRRFARFARALADMLDVRTGPELDKDKETP